MDFFGVFRLKYIVITEKVGNFARSRLQTFKILIKNIFITNYNTSNETFPKADNFNPATGHIIDNINKEMNGSYRIRLCVYTVISHEKMITDDDRDFTR